mgnify:CR=1 FL=1
MWVFHGSRFSLSRFAPLRALRAENRRSSHRSGIGTVFRHGAGRLPRRHRACPSAALDERVVNVASTAASTEKSKMSLACLDHP